MKVLVYATPIVVKRIKPLLEESKVSVVTIAEKTKEPELSLIAENLSDIGLAILDTTEEYTDSLCFLLGGLCCIPLILLVDGKLADWELLETYEAYGYLHLEAGTGEFNAYLKNILGRIQGTQRLRESMNNLLGG